MNNSDIILIGGGGHCKSCIEIIESTNEWNISGIIDLPEKLGESIFDYRIIGNDEDINKLILNGMNSFLITIGQIKNVNRRKSLFEMIIKSGGKLPVIKASSAIVTNRSEIMDGSVLMHQVFVNCGVQIGKNCIINTGVILEHDVKIGNNSHISTRSVINGDSRIGNDCFIGSGTIISNSVSICDNCIIGAGTIVTKDINQPGIYVGNPAKII